MLDFNILEPGQVHKSFKRNMVYLHKTDQFWEIVNALEVVFVGVKQMVRIWIGPSYYSIEIKST